MNFKFLKLPGSYYFLIFAGASIFFLHPFTSPFLESPAAYISERISPEGVLPEKPRHLKTPSEVRGIYMTSWVAGTKDWREELIRFIEKSELNAVVIDVKDYTGKISFEVDDEILNSLGYAEKRIPDIKNLIERLHEKNIYVIGRISVFQDQHLVLLRPDLAVKRKSGAVWKDRKGLSWIDPASREAWDLTVRVGREAEKVGFDELNFDYIRFPSDGNMNDMSYPFWDEKIPKSEVIKNFFKYLEENLYETGVPISADIFGLTTWNTDDLNIGQILENALEHFDYVSPMVYPSHYPPTFQGFKNPAAHPYEIIKEAMTRAREREFKMASSTETKLRPWIQDFDLGADYDAQMVRLEIEAVYDSGIESWLSWDPANKYTREAYELE